MFGHAGSVGRIGCDHVMLLYLLKFSSGSEWLVRIGRGFGGLGRKWEVYSASPQSISHFFSYVF